jgi:hypothetical protein
VLRLNLRFRFKSICGPTWNKIESGEAPPMLVGASPDVSSNPQEPTDYLPFAPESTGAGWNS